LPALSLLENASGAEAQLVASLLKPGVPALRPVAWKDVGIEVQVPFWEARVRREAQVLAGHTVGDIPRLLPPATWDESSRRSRSLTIGAGLAVALVGSGWTVESLPGAAFVLRRGGDSVEPFSTMLELLEGKLSEQGWHERAGALGIANLRLSVT
jgi:hypothetical protein